MPARETGPLHVSQPQLSALPAYQAPPYTDIAAVTPGTDLASLNLSWREADLPERLRTKHVHRLHPYLGKFIPQLEELRLRRHVNRRTGRRAGEFFEDILIWRKSQDQSTTP